MSDSVDPEESGPEPSGPDSELIARRDAALGLIIKFGDPVLRSRATEVTDFGPALSEEAGRMVAIMSDGMGVGLAATQISILRRLLVFQANADSEPAALVNPEIEWASGELSTAEEGCLSLPKVSMDVERPLFVRVRGVDVQGEALEIEASGLEARVLQHEIDHLDGVLILDRTARDQRKAAIRALRNGETFSPSEDEDSDPEADEVLAVDGA